jgi:hypothetical protein
MAMTLGVQGCHNPTLLCTERDILTAVASCEPNAGRWVSGRFGNDTAVARWRRGGG